MNSDGNCSLKNSRGVPPPICTHDYAAMLCIYLYRLHHRWLDNSLGCHLIRSRFESVQDHAQWMTHGLDRLFSLLCLPDCSFEFEEILWLYTAGNSVSSARSALSHARVLQTYFSSVFICYLELSSAFVLAAKETVIYRKGHQFNSIDF